MKRAPLGGRKLSAFAFAAGGPYRSPTTCPTGAYQSADAAPRHKLCPGHRRRPRGSLSAQSTQRGSRALFTGAANQ